MKMKISCMENKTQKYKNVYCICFHILNVCMYVCVHAHVPVFCVQYWKQYNISTV